MKWIKLEERQPVDKKNPDGSAKLYIVRHVFPGGYFNADCFTANYIEDNLNLRLIEYEWLDEDAVTDLTIAKDIIQNLLEGIPGQKEDADWLPDDLRKAIENATNFLELNGL